MNGFSGRLALLLLMIMLGSCATVPPGDSNQVRQQAARQGFVEQQLVAGDFTLLALHRGLAHADGHAVVYIEGDGRSYITRQRVSTDPTPRNPVALHMALADPSPAVIYIGRPCQYVMTPACQVRFWSSHRYAAVLVESISTVLDQLAAQNQLTGYGLVGYSGGGAMAALLAQRRPDIDWLVTVAANLDHAAWTSHHGDTPLTGSLNPADEMKLLAGIPQLHFAGEQDDTVPAELIEAFVQGLPPSAAAGYRPVAGMTHHGWAARWSSLVCEEVFWKQACAGH